MSVDGEQYLLLSVASSLTLSRLLSVCLFYGGYVPVVRLFSTIFPALRGRVGARFEWWNLPR